MAVRTGKYAVACLCWCDTLDDLDAAPILACIDPPLPHPKSSLRGTNRIDSFFLWNFGDADFKPATVE